VFLNLSVWGEISYLTFIVGITPIVSWQQDKAWTVCLGR